MTRRSLTNSILALLVASACSGREADADARTSPTTSIAPGDGRARLLELGDNWLRTPVHVIYRTVAPIEGQPTSTHQCLRQMVETRLDLVESLRNCSRQGRLVFRWDEPRRWSMHVTTPLQRFTARSGRRGSMICHRPSRDFRTCQILSEGEAINASGFAFLFERPSQILDALGANEAERGDARDIAGLTAECFSATGSEVHVEWCYSSQGLLLSFLRGSGSLGWTSLEATRVD
jgi:hypothetical protein